jgi:hypothetical protein
MESKLNLEFDKNVDENASICKITSFKDKDDEKNGSPCLLKHVGYVTIGNDLVIESKTEKDEKDPDAGIKIWRLIEAIIQNKI